MSNFESIPTKITQKTTNPTPTPEPPSPPDPGGGSQPEREEISNVDPSQNQSLNKFKKILWELAWIFSPNPVDVARKIKERDRRTT